MNTRLPSVFTWCWLWFCLCWCRQGREVFADEAVADAHDSIKAAGPKSDDDPVISSFVDENNDHLDLLFDENDKLASFLLVYPKHGKPPADILWGEPWYGYQHIAVTGEAAKAVFPKYQLEHYDWMVACLPKGTEQSVAGHSAWPEQQYYYMNKSKAKYMTKEEMQKDFEEWFGHNCHRVELCLTNFYDTRAKLNVYWIDTFDGTSHLDMKLQYGKYRGECFYTYLGHKFKVMASIAGQQEEEIFLDEITMEHTTVKNYGSPRKTPAPTYDSLADEIYKTLSMEWDRSNQVQRTFSPLGFAKSTLPAHIFASMSAFYYHNHEQKMVNGNGNADHVNWWDFKYNWRADNQVVYHLKLPYRLNQDWHLELQKSASKWVGDIPLEYTTMPLMRQYERHARISPHVEETKTHAIGLLINVAEYGLDEPWPIEILDHAGRLHELVLKPGEVLYYESAKILQARPRPLQGKDGAYQVTLSAFYRPGSNTRIWDRAAGDEWYKKPTGDKVSPPIMDMEGKCRITTSDDTASTDESSMQQQQQQVVCDDSRLGPYVSPALFQVQSLDDVLSWWYRTMEPNFVRHQDDSACQGDEAPDEDDVVPIHDEQTAPSEDIRDEL